MVNNLPANEGDVRDVGSIPGSGRSPGGGDGNPLQPSCLENPMDRGAWRATVHGVAESQTRRKRLTTLVLCIFCLVQISFKNTTTEEREEYPTKSSE